MNESPFRSAPFPPLPVLAAGMSTALGGVVGGCAAARGGIQRITELPPLPAAGSSLPAGTKGPPGEENSASDGGPSPKASAAGDVPDDASEEEGTAEAEEQAEPEPLYGHQVPGLPPDADGLERLALLGGAALEDLFAEVPEPGRFPGRRYALILSLPSGYLEWGREALSGEATDAFATGVFLDPGEGTRIQAYRDRLVPALLSRVPDLPPPAWTGIVAEDQAGFSEAVSRAAALLRQGRVDACLLGGIDSRVSPEALDILAELDLVAGPDFPAGFSPGEAGAFLLLGSPHAPGRPLAFVDAASQGAEANHRLSGDPPVGEALTFAARTALQNAGVAGVAPLTLAPVNGSPWTSTEWGYLLTRVPALDTEALWFPAVDFGEVGAALGAVAACMVVRGYARNYLPRERAILILSSECGRKGAVVMRQPSSSGERT